MLVYFNMTEYLKYFYLISLADCDFSGCVISDVMMSLGTTSCHQLFNIIKANVPTVSFSIDFSCSTMVPHNQWFYSGLSYSASILVSTPLTFLQQLIVKIWCFQYSSLILTTAC